MHRHDHAAGEPHAGVGGKVERLVGDAHVHRLVLGETGLCERIAHGMRLAEEPRIAQARECFPRGEALRRLGEERAEVQARREIEKAGGWRSDCATTQ
jgi:hypothetical protein